MCVKVTFYDSSCFYKTDVYGKGSTVVSIKVSLRFITDKTEGNKCGGVRLYVTSKRFYPTSADLMLTHEVSIMLCGGVVVVVVVVAESIESEEPASCPSLPSTQMDDK